MSENGIYIEIGGVVHKIIDLSDTLDGKGILSFGFDEGLRGDTIAFRVNFLDSSRGIYTAVIPEPSTALLLASGLIGLAVGRRHRS